jgi:hypothetical protein
LIKLSIEEAGTVRGRLAELVVILRSKKKLLGMLEDYMNAPSVSYTKFNVNGAITSRFTS